MTLEEAMDKIMELQTQNEQLTTERDALQSERETLQNDLNNSREQAQRYFLQLTSGTAAEADPEPEEIKSCEDLARELYHKI